MEALAEARDLFHEARDQFQSILRCMHASIVQCYEHGAMALHGIMLSSAHVRRVCRVQEARTEKRDTDEVRNLVFDLFRESAWWNFKVFVVVAHSLSLSLSVFFFFSPSLLFSLSPSPPLPLSPFLSMETQTSKMAEGQWQRRRHRRQLRDWHWHILSFSIAFTHAHAHARARTSAGIGQGCLSVQGCLCVHASVGVGGCLQGCMQCGGCLQATIHACVHPCIGEAMKQRATVKQRAKVRKDLLSTQKGLHVRASARGADSGTGECVDVS